MNWNDIFDYKDGHLFWKTGELAGTPHSMGYLQITFKGNLYVVHRVIWEMHHGPIPKGFIIDHDDRNKLNNKIDNLVLKTYQGNQRNRSKGKNNKSGFTGVSWQASRKSWKAFIGVNGKTINLGSFKDIEAALALRLQAEAAYGFHPKHGK